MHAARDEVLSRGRIIARVYLFAVNHGDTRTGINTLPVTIDRYRTIVKRKKPKSQRNVSYKRLAHCQQANQVEVAIRLRIKYQAFLQQLQLMHQEHDKEADHKRDES